MPGIGSLLALSIAVYLGGALGANTFLMYGRFFNTIPDDLDEGRQDDGATHAQIFWGMIMPLVTPILSVVGLLSFVGTYGEFILARIILARPENYTLAVGLYVFDMHARPLFGGGRGGRGHPDRPRSRHRQGIAGLTAGGVEGLIRREPAVRTLRACVACRHRLSARLGRQFQAVGP